MSNVETSLPSVWCSMFGTTHIATRALPGQLIVRRLTIEVCGYSSCRSPAFIGRLESVHPRAGKRQPRPRVVHQAVHVVAGDCGLGIKRDGDTDGLVEQDVFDLAIQSLPLPGVWFDRRCADQLLILVAGKPGKAGLRVGAEKSAAG